MKKHYLIVGFIVLVAAVAYLGLWMYSAKWFSREIDRLYAGTTKDGVIFLGAKPQLSNFPFVPEVRYTGGLQSGNFELLFPKLVLRGYPLPHANLHLSFPDGVAMGGMVDEKIWNLQFLEADISIPYHLPASFYEEDLAEWRTQGGNITIKHYNATKDTLIAQGFGHLMLDEKLQPVFNFSSVIKGYDSFISTQKDKNLIDPFAAAIGMTVLNSLSKVDEATGEKTVTLSIIVQNQMLSVGPIQALPLPLIVWDKRRPLALPQ